MLIICKCATFLVILELIVFISMNRTYSIVIFGTVLNYKKKGKKFFINEIGK
jgi:hypothetical protein